MLGEIDEWIKRKFPEQPTFTALAMGMAVPALAWLLSTAPLPRPSDLPGVVVVTVGLLLLAIGGTCLLMIVAGIVLWLGFLIDFLGISRLWNRH